MTGIRDNGAGYVYGAGLGRSKDGSGGGRRESFGSVDVNSELKASQVICFSKIE
jgi:hypothetical protein